MKQFAHAPALVAAPAASVPTMYFAFGASLSSKGLAPKLNIKHEKCNEICTILVFFSCEYLPSPNGGFTRTTL